mmetsp:Transcript_38083/g.68040  ORF Transcript_38083/g.68040 Transcript_38083/m.68040 type:complete len:100 (+) Transcript_38083:485-784(+)
MSRSPTALLQSFGTLLDMSPGAVDAVIAKLLAKTSRKIAVITMSQSLATQTRGAATTSLHTDVIAMLPKPPAAQRAQGIHGLLAATLAVQRRRRARVTI